MRPLFAVLLISATCLQVSAQRFVKVFDNIAAMLAANPNDVHTNAFVVGRTTANDGGGGIYTWNSSSTTATNSNLSVLKANNFATGRWFRNNGFVLTTLTTDRVVVIGSDSILTNGLVTLTELNFLSGTTGNIQTQIDNLAAANNWNNEGATNSTLEGIGKPWRLEVTNSVEVGQTGEAGVIEISSTNNTYTASTFVEAIGAWRFVAPPIEDDYTIGPAFLWDVDTNLTGSGDHTWWTVKDTNVIAYLSGDGAFTGVRFYAEQSPGSSTFTRVQGGDIQIDGGANTNRILLDANGEITKWHDGTNTFFVAEDSGYGAGGIRVLTDQGGLYLDISSVGGGGGNTFTTGTPSAGNVAVYTGSGTTNIVPSATLTITDTNAAFAGFISLTGTTNRLTVSGGTLLLDGATIGGSATEITITNNYIFNGKVTINTNVFLTNSGTLYVNGEPVVTASSTNTFTNKTFDADAAGNVLKQAKSLKLQYPRRIDGTGCTYSNTNDYTAERFLIPLFSGTAATNANYARYGFMIPNDWDTSVDPTIRIAEELSGADTGARNYHIGMISVANSAPANGTAANFVVVAGITDASGGSGDSETSTSATTLTGWSAAMTPNRWCVVELRRDGANDASTVGSYINEAEISYTSTQ